MRTPDHTTTQDSLGWQSNIAKALAPEDIRPGELVALLHFVCELPSFLWNCDTQTMPADAPVRIRFVPEFSGTPLKVKAVCLPFVLVKHPHGDQQTIDVRQSQLARLTGPYAKTTWKSLRKQASGKKRSRRNRR